MTRSERVLALAFAVAVVLGTASLASTGPMPCSEICDLATGHFMCYYDGGCAGAMEVCIRGQGYCQFTCFDGSVYYMICDKNCTGGGGGSPVFRKPNIEQPPAP